MDELLKEGTGMVDGSKAFELYDTYGFPLDLTQDALKVRGISVDEAGFGTAMKRQRDEARKAWAGSGDAGTDAVWFGVRDSVGATDFLGYDTESAEGRIAALVVDGKSVTRAAPGTQVSIVLNQSPFYGESGGQMGDSGITKTGEASVTVSDTQKRVDDLHVHIGLVESGTLSVGHEARQMVNDERRSRL